MYIGNVEIYKLNHWAELKYRKYAIQGKDSGTNAIERKLTALILNSENELKMLNNKYRYDFGACRIYVDENIQEIYDIEWTTGGHIKKVEPNIIKSLQDTYAELGLNKSGNKIIDNKDNETRAV